MPAPPATLDLFVVGGLTVDSFEDGSAQAGGGVLHASRAAHAAGLRVGALASAGAEELPAGAIRELRGLGLVEIQRVPESIGFAHRTEDGRRQLRFLGGGYPLVRPVGAPRAHAVLFAPVAAEVGPELLDLGGPSARRAAVLQGWLRHLVPGEQVSALPVHRLPARLAAALGGLDLLVASREDLGDGPDGPAPQLGAQLDALRAAFGPGPVIVLTDGEAGAWADITPLGERGEPGAARWHAPVPHVVRGVSSVGAGDMLAALLIAPPWPDGGDGAWFRQRLASAMWAVADLLARRR